MKKQKVLYLDVDIHHSDGVSEAFYDNKDVLTCSFHKLSPGFFPCTGHSREKGVGDGFGYNVNIPIPDRVCDEEFLSIFEYSLKELTNAFDPSCIVLAIGTDGMHGDPLVPDGWCLTTRALPRCVQLTASVSKASSLKLLLLGGGGYNDVNAARCFTACTASACSAVTPLLCKLSDEIPCHNFSHMYGPTFQLHSNNDWIKPRKKRSMDDRRKTIDLAAAHIAKIRNNSYTPFQYNDDEEDW